MQPCHIYEWVHCVPEGTTDAFPAALCEYIHTFPNLYSFQLKPWPKKWLHFHPNDFLNGKCLSAFGSQPKMLLRNLAVAIDWALSLKHPFASAYLVPFVLFGTSSSPTRQQQLSWEWRGPPGMPGLWLPRPLSQHVFVTGTQHKHTPTAATLIWGTLSNVTLYNWWRCHWLTDSLEMLE